MPRHQTITENISVPLANYRSMSPETAARRKAKSAEWRRNNAERVKAVHALWIERKLESDPEYILRSAREYYKRRKESDPEGMRQKQREAYLRKKALRVPQE